MVRPRKVIHPFESRDGSLRAPNVPASTTSRPVGRIGGLGPAMARTRVVGPARGPADPTPVPRTACCCSDRLEIHVRRPAISRRVRSRRSRCARVRRARLRHRVRLFRRSLHHQPHARPSSSPPWSRITASPACAPRTASTSAPTCCCRPTRCRPPGSARTSTRLRFRRRSTARARSGTWRAPSGSSCRWRFATECGGVQIDLYTPPRRSPRSRQPFVGHDGHLIKGFIWRWWLNGKPLLCGGGTPTPTPSESSTAPPTRRSRAPHLPRRRRSRAPHPHRPRPRPLRPPRPRPRPPRRRSPPARPRSSRRPEGTPGPVAEVPTLPTANTTPVLASTGSNATIPLIGIGTALVGVGVLLSLLGRRRKTA